MTDHFPRVQTLPYAQCLTSSWRFYFKFLTSCNSSISFIIKYWRLVLGTTACYVYHEHRIAYVSTLSETSSLLKLVALDIREALWDQLRSYSLERSFILFVERIFGSARPSSRGSQLLWPCLYDEIYDQSEQDRRMKNWREFNKFMTRVPLLPYVASVI